jgi:hypothetical protein
MKLALITSTLAALSGAALAQPAPMSFFVTSKGLPGGANLGGLAGADRHCQALAAAAGAGGRTWRAYLSAGPDGKRAAVDARDRIGAGPWVNARGALVARDVDELHGGLVRLDRHTALDERGAPVPGEEHDVLTGSDADGRLAFTKDGLPATCGDWTRGGDGAARIGHADRFEAASHGNKRFPRWQGSWVSEHTTIGCDARRLAETGGGGRFYCFAVEGSPGAAPPIATTPPSGATFRRGLNVNHWLGDNLPAHMLADSLYAAAWFDEEDVRWIAGRGFDHLRIAVNGAVWITPQGDLDEAALAPFDRALAHARAHGLGVVLEMTGLPGYRSALRGEQIPDAASPFTDEATQGDAAYLWWLVARRYAAEGDALRFELVGGPRAEETAHILAFNRRALAAIRRVSPTRVVYLAPREPSPDRVAEVELPDPYTAPTVYFWDPEAFAFQADRKLPLVRFPGRVDGQPVDAALIDARVERFARRARAAAGAREVYVGSWGVYHRADDDSARRYVRAVQAALERHGLAWAIYDYHTGCAVRGEDGKPTRVLEALTLPTPSR